MELDLETTPHSKDATLVDSRTKRPLYRITDFVLSLFKYKPNIVSRLSEVADKEEDLAEIKRGWFGDYITLESDGVRMKANKLFDVGVLQGHHSFTGPDGRTRYRWELETQGLKVVRCRASMLSALPMDVFMLMLTIARNSPTTDDQARTLIAQYSEERRSHLGLGGVKALPRLVVMQAGLDMLDMIVITLAYVEKKREEVKITTTAAVAAA